MVVKKVTTGGVLQGFFFVLGLFNAFVKDFDKSFKGMLSKVVDDIELQRGLAERG